MNRLILITALILGLSAVSQTITQEGYNYVTNSFGDTINRHSTLRKSYQTALTQPSIVSVDTFYIEQPRLRIVVTKKVTNLYFKTFEFVNVTSSSVEIKMSVSNNDLHTVILTMKEKSSDIWKDYFISSNFSNYETNEPLLPGTTYMFQLYILTNDGQEVNSVVYYITTLN